MVVSCGSSKVVTTTMVFVLNPGWSNAKASFANRHVFWQRFVGWPIDRANRRRLMPADDVIVVTQAFSAAKVRFPVGFVESTDQVDAALLKQHDPRPIGHQAKGGWQFRSVSPVCNLAARSRRAVSATTFDGTLICDMSSDTSPAEELSAKGLAVTSAANPTFLTRYPSSMN